MAYSADAKNFAVTRLDELIQASPTGEVPNALVRDAITSVVDAPPSTVRRWWRQSRERNDSTDEPPITEQQTEVIFAKGGNVRAAHRHLRKHAGYPYSYPTLWRAWTNGVPQEVRTFARGGAEAAKVFRQVIRGENGPPNVVHQLDSTQLPVRTRGTDADRWWLTVILDAGCRRAVNAILTAGRPNRDDVLALLLDAFEVHEVAVPDDLEDLVRTRNDAMVDPPADTPGGRPTVRLGGRPQVLIYDEAKEFLADAVTEVLAVFGIRGLPVAWNPNAKARLERWNGTLKTELIPALPGWVKGPTTHTQKNPMAGASRPLNLDEAQFELSTWLDHYNAERVHDAHATTPLRYFIAADPEIVVPDPTQISEFLPAVGARQVTRDGIQHLGFYQDPALREHIGRTAFIRAPLHHNDFVAVYVDEAFVCRAYRTGKLTPATRRAIHSRNIDGYRMCRGFLDNSVKRRAEATEDARRDGTPIWDSDLANVTSDAVAPDEDAAFDLLVARTSDTSPTTTDPAADTTDGDTDDGPDDVLSTVDGDDLLLDDEEMTDDDRP
jgi:hypothetical protein